MRTALRLIRRHERSSRKLARYNNHLTFLTRCIKSHIIPRYKSIQPPVSTKGARRVAELASMRFLRERIRLTQRAKGDAKRETKSTARGITAALTADEASEMLEKIRVNIQRVFTATKDRQRRTFLKLVQQKQASVSKTPHADQTPRVDRNEWVINLSSRPLSDAEVSLLEKGLNFAVTPTNISATEIVAKVESAIRTLDSERADTVRRSVNNILQQAEPPKPNITREMQEALKSECCQNQTFSKYCGNSSKLNSAHILVLGRP